MRKWVSSAMIAILALAIGSIVIVDVKGDLQESLIPPLKVTKSFSGDELGKFIVPMVIKNQVAYTGFEKGPDFGVAAIDLEKGSLIWKFSTQPKTNLMVSPPVMAEGIIYFTTGDGDCYALDAEIGNVIWSSDFMGGNRGVSTLRPAVAEGIVYLGSYGDSSESNYLYSLDAKTGKLLWKLPIRVEHSPVVAEGMVYISSAYPSGLKLYAIEGKSGKLKWILEAGEPPFISEGLLYTICHTTDGPCLLALDAKKGTQTWNFSGVSQIIAVENELLYTDQGIFDGKTGMLRQKVCLPSQRRGDLPEPNNIVVKNGIIYTLANYRSTSGNSYIVLGVVDASTGRLIWYYPIADEITSETNLIVSNDILYFGGVIWLGKGLETSYQRALVLMFENQDSPKAFVSSSSDIALYPNGKSIGFSFTPLDILRSNLIWTVAIAILTTFSLIDFKKKRK